VAAEVYRVEIPITAIDRTEPAMTRARAKVSAFEKSLAAMQTRMRTWGASLTSFGRTMTRNVSLPIVAAGAASLKMYADFEKSFTDIRALVGIGGKQLAGMRAQTLELARSMPQGPQALADALYFVTSSGFKGAEAMSILEASAKAAAAGLGDTMTVADAVTSAVNAYGISNLEASRATDILLATVREGKSEPTELAGAIGRVIAPAEAMGVAFDEVGASLAGLSLTGLDAAEATTALRGILTTFMAPTLKTTEALKGMGWGVKELQRGIDRDFMGTMMELREELGNDKVAMGEVFGNVRALNGFLALTGRNAEKNAGIFRDLGVAVGDTDKAFKRASDDPMFRFNKAMSNIKTTLIEVAPTILPVAEKIIRMLEGWAKAIGRMDEEKLERIVKLLGAAMIAGPAMRLVGGLLSGGGALIGAGRGLGRFLLGTGGKVAGGAGAGAATRGVGSALGKAGLLRVLGGALGMGAGAGAAVLGGGALIGGIAIGNKIVSDRRRAAEGEIREHGFSSPQGEKARGTLGIGRKDIAMYNREIAEYRKMETDQGRLTIDQERALKGLLSARRSVMEEIARRRKEDNETAQRPLQTQLGLLEAVNGKLTAQEQIRVNTLVLEGKLKKAVEVVGGAVKRANEKWLDQQKHIKGIKDGWTGVSGAVDFTTRRQERLEQAMRDLKRVGTDTLLSLINTYGDAEDAALALQRANAADNWGWETGGGVPTGGGGSGKRSGRKGGKGGRGGNPVKLPGTGPSPVLSVGEGAVVIHANKLDDETVEHAADLLAARLSQHLENTA
jgi:TP901 family phage tail tape measure protein